MGDPVRMPLGCPPVESIKSPEASSWRQEPISAASADMAANANTYATTKEAMTDFMEFLIVVK